MQARAAFDAGRIARAHELIDRAEALDPDRSDWARARSVIGAVPATSAATAGPAPAAARPHNPATEPDATTVPSLRTAAETDLVARTVAQLRSRTAAMRTGQEWSDTLAQLPEDARGQVLGELGFDELDAMLEPAVLSGERWWRDELIGRIETTHPDIARAARQAAAGSDAAVLDVTSQPAEAADEADAPGPAKEISPPASEPDVDESPVAAPAAELAPDEGAPATTPQVATPAFLPGSIRPPTGAKARVEANLAALWTLRDLRDRPRPANAAQQQVLGRWSGWGAVPEVFDRLRSDLQWARDELTELLDESELAKARTSMLNAHYTDPDLVTQIWSAVGDLGFERGRVLEPGCGTGNFVGLAPPGAAMVGVEVEPTTAAIARALQPDAQILTESFADTRVSNGSFDLVVGNVPFAKTVLSDKLHNSGGHSIHNHFLVKSLHLTAPGGLVAAITSRYTLDAQNPAARREMAELADLVGAIRLPQAAHQQTAGTAVITDLLIFRRREAGREPQPFDWELSELVDVDGEQVRMNNWFARRPEMLCGELTVGSGQYSSAEPRVISDRPAAELLGERLDLVVAHAKQAGLRHAPVAAEAPHRAALVGPPADFEDGHILVDENGEFRQVSDRVAEPMEVPKTRATELGVLVGLRDTATALLEAEAATYDHDDGIEQLRADLNQQYDAYAARYGPINRFKWRRTGRVDAEGNDVHARIADKLGGFRTDPRAALVLALEKFDASTGTAAKADVFEQRVVAPRAPVRGAETPADALAVCMDTHGTVDLPEIARLLGTDEHDARAGLGNLVFADPSQQGQLVPAADYLSGHVRDKLAQARAAADEQPTYETNVDALTEVVPPDIAPADIVARLGVPWIEAAYVQQFLRETLEDPGLTVEHMYGTNWNVDGNDFSVTATSTWGTERYPATDLAQALLAQRSIVVHDEVDAVTADGAKTTRRVLNPGATTAAQAKADELAERFGEWVWESPQRATDLARVYNDRFNSLVLRNYDDVKLALPGLALTFNPAQHQVAAVARMLAEPAVGLYHEVGAGKTAEMAIGVMELRRLGMVSKPVIVIPNHMIEQWSREFQQLYPRARVLAASSADLKKQARREFVARVATGDWDAVIMTRGAFERIPMTPENQEDYLNAELAELEEALERKREAADSGRGRQSVKRMQQQLENSKQRIKDKLAGDFDPAISFEGTGIDYIVVDEAHDYKNLRTASNIAGAEIEGSNRAQDLAMKLHYLRGKHGDRVVTLATATPIANSITEAHVMQRYLRPDLLESAGVANFDTWAATFAATISDVELSPDGSSFRMKARFARFHNVPELLRMWWVSGDIKTAEDLDLPRPDLVARPDDGERAPRTILVPATEGQAELLEELGRRAERVQSRAVDKRIDNMLMVSGDGRAGALDLRLLGRDMPEGESKLEAAADEIASIWAEHKDDQFLDADGESHPTLGAMQLVFCDLGTPSSEGKKAASWNVYSELREQLVTRGLPRAQVRFIHEATNDQKKAQLFQACRVGEIAVLIGSTSKMGVGTNVQDRVVALHHLDCPWRPADLAQRDGRALRRGNQYAEIALNRYVVEGTFDAYMWQALARKQAFISQLMNGKLGVREIDGDIGDSALSYNEVKALAAGNPLLLEKAKADADLMRLERLERSHMQTRSRLRFTIEQSQTRVPEIEGDLLALRQSVETRTDTRGEAFSMVVAGQPLDERTEAAKRILDRLTSAIQGPQSETPTDLPGIARLGGLSFDATVWTDRLRAGYQLQIAGVRRGGCVDGSKQQLLETAHGEKPSSLVVRMENLMSALERKVDRAEQDLQSCLADVEQAHKQLDRPFTQAADLSAARKLAQEINEQMNDLAVPASPGTESQPSPDTVPTSPTVAHPAAIAAAATRVPAQAAKPATTTAGPGASMKSAGLPTQPVAPVPDPPSLDQDTSSRRHR